MLAEVYSAAAYRAGRPNRFRGGACSSAASAEVEEEDVNRRCGWGGNGTRRRTRQRPRADGRRSSPRFSTRSGGDGRKNRDAERPANAGRARRRARKRTVDAAFAAGALSCSLAAGTNRVQSALAVVRSMVARPICAGRGRMQSQQTGLGPSARPPSGEDLFSGGGSGFTFFADSRATRAVVGFRFPRKRLFREIQSEIFAPGRCWMLPVRTIALLRAKTKPPSEGKSIAIG